MGNLRRTFYIYNPSLITNVDPSVFSLEPFVCFKVLDDDFLMGLISICLYYMPMPIANRFTSLPI